MISAARSYPPRLLPLRMPRVCVAVTSSDPAELVEKAEALIRDNSFLEFRLDYISKPSLALPKIKHFLDTHPGTVVIATCRRVASGGRFRGSIASQLDLLAKASAAGCQLVDVELQTALKCKPAQLQKLRGRSALILSYHDFRGTKKLDETLEKMRAFPADFYKVVSTASTLSVNVTMIQFLGRESDNHSLVGLCMGEQGIISRVLGVRAGSVFTFAAAGPGEETAPGQATAQDLRSVYRIESVDAATRVYGVAGDPVAHSLSPAIMNAAFRRENVNAVYLALHAKTLKDLLHCVRDIPIHGLSITMPYKEAILPYLDNTDSHTTKIGACNTVVRAQDGKLYGFNTDTSGVVRPLERRLSTLQDAKILVLGAGGAARAAVFGLRERGAEVYILNRSAAPAQKLARGAPTLRAPSNALPTSKKYVFDVIVNATPVGMGNSRETPLQEKEINARFVFDMIYDPPETRLLQLAKERGAQIIPGIEMFVHQAARQFEIWTGKPAPQDDMMQVVTCWPCRNARKPRGSGSGSGEEEVRLTRVHGPRQRRLLRNTSRKRVSSSLLQPLAIGILISFCIVKLSSSTSSPASAITAISAMNSITSTWPATSIGAMSMPRHWSLSTPRSRCGWEGHSRRCEFLPALAGAGLIAISILIARELGGGRYAQFLAGFFVLLCPAVLWAGSLFTNNAFEPLFWMGAILVVARILRTGDSRLWLWFGVLAGLGLENKHSTLSFGFAVTVALLLTHHRREFASRWIWIAGAIAFAIFLPNIIWQIRHHFPTIEDLANVRREGKNRQRSARSLSSKSRSSTSTQSCFQSGSRD